MTKAQQRVRSLLTPCFVVLVAWLVACRGVPSTRPQSIGQPAVTLQPTATIFSTLAPSPTLSVPTKTPVPSKTATATSIPITSPPPSPDLTPTPTPSLIPSETPDPYAHLTIQALARRSYGGGLLRIAETLERNERFARYQITYPSDGLSIAGFINVPHEGDRFPVAIVLHGYIDPAEYDIVDYTRRYADALADAGYFVVHPNLRNYPPSDSGSDEYRVGTAIDVLNLIAVIREQSQDPTGTLRRADADDINLWGHSMGGGVALRVITVNNEPYLKAAVLYGSMSGDETLNYRRILRWSNGNRGEFELAASTETLQAISPIYHLDRIRAGVSIHHSEADTVVPFEWSSDLCERLQTLAHPTECYTYYGQPHTFRGSGDSLFMERVISFFDSH